MIYSLRPLTHRLDTMKPMALPPLRWTLFIGTLLGSIPESLLKMVTESFPSFLFRFIPRMVLTMATLSSELTRPTRNPVFRDILNSDFLAKTVTLALKLVRRSWSIQHTRVHPDTQALFDAGTPVIFAAWHGRLFLSMTMAPPEEMAVLISNSNDGHRLSQWIGGLGFHRVIRGSHRRDGEQASREIIRTLRREKKSIYMALDGPRGPRYRVKNGLLRLAAMTQTPIVPVSGSAKYLLKRFTHSWDHFMAPLPFTPLAMSYGAPIQVPKGLSTKEELLPYRRVLQSHLRQMTWDMDKYYGHPQFDTLIKDKPNLGSPSQNKPQPTENTPLQTC